VDFARTPTDSIGKAISVGHISLKLQLQRWKWSPQSILPLSIHSQSISMPSAAADMAEASIFTHDAYPSIERFQTLDGLLQSHAAEPDQKPLICYPKTGVDDFEEHTAVALDRYTDAAVKFYIQQGLNYAVCTPGTQVKELN